MSDPDKRGYRKRTNNIWRTEGSFEATEQRIVDQVKNIQRKGWLSKLQLEVIKRDLMNLNDERNRNSSVDVANEANLEISEEEHMLGQQSEVNQETERTDTVSYPDELEEDQSEILGRIKELMNEESLETPINLRKFDRMKVKEKALVVDKVLQQVETGNITDTNKLIKVGALVTQELLGVKRPPASEKKHEPYWERRIENSINSLRKDLSQLQRRDRGKLRREGDMKRLERKYNIKKKGSHVVKEEIRQRIVAKAAKVKRFNDRMKQFRQNRLYQVNQKELFREINGNNNVHDIAPDAQMTKEFWSNIWERETTHNHEAGWIKNVEEDLKREQRTNVTILLYHY